MFSYENDMIADEGTLPNCHNKNIATIMGHELRRQNKSIYHSTFTTVEVGAFTKPHKENTFVT